MTARRWHEDRSSSRRSKGRERGLRRGQLGRIQFTGDRQHSGQGGTLHRRCPRRRSTAIPDIGLLPVSSQAYALIIAISEIIRRQQITFVRCLPKQGSRLPRGLWRAPQQQFLRAVERGDPAILPHVAGSGLVAPATFGWLPERREVAARGRDAAGQRLAEIPQRLIPVGRNAVT